MRLIDADTLKEWIENWFVMNAYYHPYSKTKNIPVTEVYDILEKLPTIEAETKHGRWVIESDEAVMHCNSCGWLVEYYAGLEEEWNFCPRCGADMQGVEE